MLSPLSGGTILRQPNRTKSLIGKYFRSAACQNPCLWVTQGKGLSITDPSTVSAIVNDPSSENYQRNSDFAVGFRLICL